MFICLCSTAAAQVSLTENTVYLWEIDAPWFGGWSGVEVTDHGTKLTVISDRGHLAQARMNRTDGVLTSVTVQTQTPLGRAAGGKIRKTASDAEGLAISEQGRAFVSFEHHHRVMRTDTKSGRTSDRIALPFQNTLGANAGIEALAISADGTLFAIGEKPQADDAPFALHAYAGGKWHTRAYIPQRGSFVPVGADFDSKGRLWLLERAVTLIGFRSRVRLFDLDHKTLGAQTVLTTLPAQYDNLEGISVWDDAKGQTHVTMISDDNFMHFFQSKIVEYTVQE